MKRLSNALILVLSVSLMSTALASSDRKLGNVIAVERSIDNIYQSCLEQLQREPSDNGSLQSCTFEPRKTSADTSPGKQRLLNFKNKSCMVEGSLQNNVILVIYQSLIPKATLENAKQCLQEALQASPHKDSFKFIMHTIE